MMPSTRPTRGDQPSTSGLGLQFESPVKRRNKKKTTTYVIPPGNAAKRRRLLEKLEKLKAPQPVETRSPIVNEDHFTPVADDPALELAELPMHLADQSSIIHPSQEREQTRRTVPDQTANNLYDKWAQVLPSLIDPLLAYVTESMGNIVKLVTLLHCKCLKSCTLKTSKILCLFYDRKSSGSFVVLLCLHDMTTCRF
jgi:hypothetical protein